MSAEETSPTSLSLLEDIVVPEPVSWWPLAPAWWVLFAAIALAAIAAGWIGWRRWRVNAYRRAAMKELEALDENAAGVPALLKRVALASWPRSEVASLAGDRWISFLRDASPGSFDSQTADDLLAIDYGSAELAADRQKQLINSAKSWISTHRKPSP